jgi:hypothetical protein
MCRECTAAGSHSHLKVSLSSSKIFASRVAGIREFGSDAQKSGGFCYTTIRAHGGILSGIDLKRQCPTRRDSRRALSPIESSDLDTPCHASKPVSYHVV